MPVCTLVGLPTRTSAHWAAGSPAGHPIDISASLLASAPACLLTCFSNHLRPARLPSCPPARQPVCPPAVHPASSPVRLPARSPAYPPLRLPVCPRFNVPALPPVRLLASPPSYLLPLHLPACRLPAFPPAHASVSASPPTACPSPRVRMSWYFSFHACLSAPCTPASPRACWPTTLKSRFCQYKYRKISVLP